VLVVAVSERPADAVAVADADRDGSVATYETNADYADDDPVVGAVYADSVAIGADGPSAASLRVYVFPRGRLVAVD